MTVLHSTSHKADTDLVYWCLNHIYELVPVHTVAQGLGCGVLAAPVQTKSTYPEISTSEFDLLRKKKNPTFDVTPHLRLFSFLSDWFHMNQKRAATGISLDSTPRFSHTLRSLGCTFPFLSSSQDKLLSQQSSPKDFVCFLSRGHFLALFSKLTYVGS